MPALGDVPGDRGVLVRVLRVGLDGTDREISSGAYGTAPPGSDVLVMGHESLGVVEAVGGAVTGIHPGDLVVAQVRRPGSSLYDVIGRPDLTTDDTYFEHGISRLHGFLTEYYVDTPEYLVTVPRHLDEVGVLLEPTSIVEKGIGEAFEVQGRLRVWRPHRVAVLGAGTLGLLATMVLRARSLDVTTLSLEEAPSVHSELVEAIGARYVSSRERTLAEVAAADGPFDLIVEATGYSPLAFQAMTVLARNGVLVLSSVTEGSRTVAVPTDAINLSFVLGNRAMIGTVNAAHEHFAAGVHDMAYIDALYPGWLARLITHRVSGLEAFGRALDLLAGDHAAIKIVVEVAPR